MDLELNGQVVAVLGAARGIGEAIAAAFAAEGASVAAIDRDPRVGEVAERLGAMGGTERRTIGIVADVTDHAAIRRAADSIRGELGRCDHVIFAVAIGSGKFGFPFWKLEPDDWDRVLRVNLVGAVAVAHAFAPLLVERKDGSMLFLASVAGQIGSQTDPPYSASKAGLINFTQCAARDLAPHGVRVNALCPGMVQTPLNRSTWDAWNRRQPEESRQSYEDWAAAKIKQLVPLNRWQQPEDIAAMAVFLASHKGRNITGQTINVDGGYVMHW